MPYEEHPDRETIENVHGELWALSLTLYEQDAVKESRLLTEVLRLYELHYGIGPQSGFQSRAVRSEPDAKVHAQCG